MKTLSPTQARGNMTRWLDQAFAGQSIGITHKGWIIKLQPLPVTEDWALVEYGLTGEEMDRAAANLLKTGEDVLVSGKAVSWEQFKKRRKANQGACPTDRPNPRPPGQVVPVAET